MLAFVNGVPVGEKKSPIGSRPFATVQAHNFPITLSEAIKSEAHVTKSFEDALMVKNGSSLFQEVGHS